MRTDVYERRLLRVVKALPYSGAITVLAGAGMPGGYPPSRRRTKAAYRASPTHRERDAMFAKLLVSAQQTDATK